MICTAGLVLLFSWYSCSPEKDYIHWQESIKLCLSYCGVDMGAHSACLAMQTMWSITVSVLPLRPQNDMSMVTKNPLLKKNCFFLSNWSNISKFTRLDLHRKWIPKNTVAIGSVCSCIAAVCNVSHAVPLNCICLDTTHLGSLLRTKWVQFSSS